MTPKKKDVLSEQKFNDRVRVTSTDIEPLRQFVNAELVVVK